MSIFFSNYLLKRKAPTYQKLDVPRVRHEVEGNMTKEQVQGTFCLKVGSGSRLETYSAIERCLDVSSFSIKATPVLR